MKEVKSPKKPLIYYHGVVLLVICFFNFIITPLLAQTSKRGGLRCLHGHD